MKLSDSDKTFNVLVVEHKDHLTRFGTRYIEILLVATGRRLEVVNGVPDDTEDLMTDANECYYVVLCKAIRNEEI